MNSKEMIVGLELQAAEIRDAMIPYVENANHTHRLSFGGYRVSDDTVQLVELRQKLDKVEKRIQVVRMNSARKN